MKHNKYSHFYDDEMICYEERVYSGAFYLLMISIILAAIGFIVGVLLKQYNKTVLIQSSILFALPWIVLIFFALRDNFKHAKERRAKNGSS